MFSKKLKKAMEINNISQAELSRKSGISKSSISQYLSGKFIPKAANLTKICKALEVSMNFFTDEDVSLAIFTKEEEFSNSYISTSKNELKTIIYGIFSDPEFIKSVEKIQKKDSKKFLKSLEQLIINRI